MAVEPAETTPVEEPAARPGNVFEARLGQVLAASPLISKVLALLGTIDSPPLWLGAGSVCDTVWNAAYGYDPAHGIKDLDIVYFDQTVTPDEETQLAARVCGLVGGLGMWVDVKNQASVHTWYAARFGAGIAPYTSLVDALSTWPTTSAAVAVRLDAGRFAVTAPFGLEDLFNLIVRPNRVQIARHDFEQKAARWRVEWPQLTILGWEDGVGVEGTRLIQP